MLLPLNYVECLPILQNMKNFNFYPFKLLKSSLNQANGRKMTGIIILVLVENLNEYLGLK